ncbi:MAG: MnhB domain-containing protein [Candidatus Methanofastidiosia archaeon]|jgi:multicomponent Na+:H+ antiporter subunit B
MSIIVKTATRFLAPLMLLFGAYIVLTGHITPGGGFQGGVILGSVLLLFFLAFGLKEGKFSENVASFIEDASALLLVVVGLLGMIIGKAFLSNFLVGTIIKPGTIPLINTLIGLKVGTAFAVLFYTFFKYTERVS